MRGPASTLEYVARRGAEVLSKFYEMCETHGALAVWRSILRRPEQLSGLLHKARDVIFPLLACPRRRP